jgi:glutathione synthase/RimK-type ligase-like ATP-grasp enzyme/ribosomal protein S18 acetylase RimI-like enzyme
MEFSIRRSTPDDLNAILSLEKKVFPHFQQSSRSTLSLSLKSSFQQVWVAENISDNKHKILGCLILYTYKKAVRIFSVAVDSEEQGKGIGKMLLNKAHEIAVAQKAERITLEVDADNKKLIEWYKKEGFESTELLKDYYEEGVDGFRMVHTLPIAEIRNRVSNLIVVDNPGDWKMDMENVEVMSSRDYCSNKGEISERSVRVFNLCNSYRYQSMGYYVSLLASAREHRSIPNVTTIRDLGNRSVIQTIADDIDEVIQKSLRKVNDTTFKLNVYFGRTLDESYKQLGANLYQIFEAPAYCVEFQKSDRWEIKKISPLSLNKIESDILPKVKAYAQAYFKTQRFQRSKLKHYKYYLAVLVDPSEQNPPSDKKALKRLSEAAEDFEIYTETITRKDIHRLLEFDALFIRETTNVNNHTYQFSRKAYAEGLAVIDDPWSILRCSNKIFLHESLKLNNILTPKTNVFVRGMVKSQDLQLLTYPIILKQPDSAFSLGVTKVKNSEELKESLDRLFKQSDLVIAQEFLPSDYDWRIGMLDNKPLFACKYYMAKGHWQIYNWKGAKKDQTGTAETMKIEDVPKKVLKTATKAANVMGDGLYGVDLKVIGDQVYVIEVNDNPNIDTGVEDKVLGKELYKRIVQSLLTRIEMARNIERFVSVEPD